MKSRESVMSELHAIAAGLSMLGLLRLLGCARVLNEKEIKEREGSGNEKSHRREIL